MGTRDPTSWMRAEYESLRAQSLDWKLRGLQGPSAPRSRVDGKDVIMLSSNNYPNLAGEGDAILTDELNHGSIIDGVRLTKAQRYIYKHCDMGDLERVLKEVDGSAKRILVVSDGVFSMDGDIAPVDGIAKLAEEFGAMVYIDDAHGEGVLGDGGG